MMVYSPVHPEDVQDLQREITPDGFVGFAGWAGDHNVQPILTAFCRWVDELTPAAAAQSR